MANKDKNDLDKILDSFPTSCKIDYAHCISNENDEYGIEPPDKATVVLSVSKTGWGFGQFAFVQDKDGQLYINTECSNLETVIEAVTNWIKSGITDWDDDPERHKRYNEVMKRSCGDWCKVCK